MTCYGCSAVVDPVGHVVVVRVERWVADLASLVTSPNADGRLMVALCDACLYDIKHRTRSVIGHVFKWDDPGLAQALTRSSTVLLPVQ